MIQWIIFSGKRAGRPRTKTFGAEVWRARSARKGCQWQAFSVERAGRPRPRRPPTFPLSNFCFSMSCFNQRIDNMLKAFNRRKVSCRLKAFFLTAYPL